MQSPSLTKNLPLYKGEDQTGKVWNNWEVLGFEQYDPVNHNHLWLCRCLKCRTVYDVNYNNIVLGKSKSCHSCSGRSGKDNSNWRGVWDIPAALFYRYKFGAEIREIDFTVTIEELDGLWSKQKGICALSGVSISINDTASLDRINSSQGYKKENLQWVHKTVNKMKNDLDEKEFTKFCSLIHEYHTSGDY